MSGIFDFELLYRVRRTAPTVSHAFCRHEVGQCLQDFVTEWHQPGLEKTWVVSFQRELLVSQDGIDLWKRLIEQGSDAGEIIDAVALAVGDQFSDEKALTDRSQAQMLRAFLTKALPIIGKLNQELQLVKEQRDGPSVHA